MLIYILTFLTIFPGNVRKEKGRYGQLIHVLPTQLMHEYVIGMWGSGEMVLNVETECSHSQVSQVMDEHK